MAKPSSNTMMVNSNKSKLSARKRTAKVIVVVTPFLIIVSLLYAKNVNPLLYRQLIKEDGLIEYLTFFNYLLAFFVGLLMANTFRRQGRKILFALYFLLSLFFVFVAGEEISWGQRIFNIRPPAFFLENSFQWETNLHNLKQVRDIDPYLAAKVFIFIGLVGAFAWAVLACFKPLNLEGPQKTITSFLVPPWYFVGYFLPVAAYFYYLAYLWPGYRHLGIGVREQEPMEFILSLGFVLFVVSNRIAQNMKSELGNSAVRAASGIDRSG